MNSHFLPILQAAILKAVVGLFFTISGVITFAQTNTSSVLAVIESANLLSKTKKTSPAASVIQAVEKALASGGKIGETDKDGNSSFAYVLLYATTCCDQLNSSDANSLVRAMVRLGADVNLPVGPKGEELAPICIPFVWGTLNNELVQILFKAGAAKAVKCQGQPLYEVAKQQAINPKLIELLENRK